MSHRACVTDEYSARDGIGLVQRVSLLKDECRHTWRDRPQWYWMLGLLEEVVELGLSLVGLHKGPVEWELLQISSICLNWIEYRVDIEGKNAKTSTTSHN